MSTRRRATGLLRRFGLSLGVADAVAGIFAREWRTLSAVMVLALLIPIIELGLVGALYSAMSPDTAGKLQELARQVLQLLAIDVKPRAVAVTLLVVSFAALGLLVAARLLHKRANLAASIRSYLHYSRLLAASFLNAPPNTSRRLDRAAFANAIHGEVWAVGGLVYDLVSALSNVISALVLLVGSWMIAPYMTLAAIVAAGIMALLFRGRYRIQRAIVREKLDAQTALLDRTVDVLSGYQPIRLAGAESTFADRLGLLFVRTTRWRERYVHNQTLLATLSQAFVYLIMLGVAAGAVISGDNVGGRAIVILILMQRIFSSASLVQQDWLRAQTQTGTAARVVGLIEQTGWKPAGAVAQRDRQPITSVQFDRVSFGYGDDAPVFSDVNFELRAGDRILVQGRSGIGKSSLALLATGLLEPLEGRVLLNGRELDDALFRQLRDQIAYVSPALHVFDLSIRDNVYLSGGGSEEELRELLGTTGLAELQARLGTDDRTVGPSGNGLSLGERQRLVLLQAFVKRPSFLILDEATSNLDVALEESVMRELLERLPPRTILLVIAHKRPRGIEFTREYTLQRGKLVPLRSDSFTVAAV